MHAFGGPELFGKYYMAYHVICHVPELAEDAEPLEPMPEPMCIA